MENKLKNTTIMVVDDTPANLRLLQQMLSHVGYRVLTMPRGELALKAMSVNPPDLLLLDINMPGMDGYEVCRKLKADEKLNEIPVLFISAYTELDEKLKAFDAGGVDYISKPFYEAEVLARVKTHLALHRQKLEIADNYLKLHELNGLRDNLTQMIVHDLRSPLTAIHGSLEVLDLLLNDNAKENILELIQNARWSTGKMIEMISTILDLSRLESEKMPLQIEEVDVKVLLNESLEFFREIAKSISFDLQIDVNPSTAFFDKQLIRRVLVNLIGNAVKFSPEESVITIATSKVDDSIQFRVKDNGPGISAENHELIFEKYGQVKARQTGYSSGIGLAFCKLAVEAHQGTIGIESEEGKGSVFWFTLRSSLRD